MSSFISAGHYLKDSGAVSGKYKENELAMELRDLVVPKAKTLGLTVITDRDVETLVQYLNRIKPGDGSVIIEFHWNSASTIATGTEVLVADTSSQNSKNFAKELVDITSEILGIKNRGVKTESQSARGKLGLLRKEGIAALVEVCFINNPDDMKAYEANKEKLADAYAKIIKKYDDLIK